MFCYHEDREKINSYKINEELEILHGQQVTKITYGITYLCLECGREIEEDVSTYEDMDEDTIMEDCCILWSYNTVAINVVSNKKA